MGNPTTTHTNNNIQASIMIFKIFAFLLLAGWFEQIATQGAAVTESGRKIRAAGDNSFLSNFGVNNLKPKSSLKKKCYKYGGAYLRGRKVEVDCKTKKIPF